MIKRQNFTTARKMLSQAEANPSRTYIVADKWLEDITGTSEEVFIAESLLTRRARDLDDNDAGEDDGGMDIQIIDLEADEDELDEELDLDDEEGDIEADWKRGEVSGGETPGITAATSDQHEVDQIGRAAGMVYDDDEPLNFAQKIGQRDRERWELNPDSIDPDTLELSTEPLVVQHRQAAD